MSIEAVQWAWAVTAPDARCKAVLVRLADHARSPDYIAFASAGSLHRDTQLDRKTVLAALHKLEEAHLIERIEQRHGLGGAPAFKVLWSPPPEGQTRTESGTTSPRGSRPKSGTASRPRPAVSPPGTGTKSGWKQYQFCPEVVPNPGYITVSTVPTVNTERAHAGVRMTSAPKQRKALPLDFGISDKVGTWAMANGFDRLHEHLELFKLKAEAKDYRYADWDAAFMRAIREDWAGLRKPSTTSHRRDLDARAQVWVPGSAAKPHVPALPFEVIDHDDT